MSAEKRLPIMRHVLELRNRLVWAGIAVLVTTVVAFVFADQLFAILKHPVGDITFIYTDVTEMLAVYMKVCLTAGIIAAMPFIIYQFVMFVSPALSKTEKKYVFLIVPWIAGMFVGGVAFGYFVLMPPAMRFLLTFGNEVASPLLKIGNYASVVTQLLLAIGLIFEMPVIMTFLARIGVVSYKWLANKRRWAVLLAFVAAAIITPTADPINQILMASPIIVLYEMGVWLARLVQRQKPTRISNEPSPG